MFGFFQSRLANLDDEFTTACRDLSGPALSAKLRDVEYKVMKATPTSKEAAAGYKGNLLAAIRNAIERD